MKVSKDSICVFLLSIHMLLLILNGTTFFSIGNRAYIYLLVIIIEILYLATRMVNISRFFDMKRKVCLFMIAYSLFSIMFVNQDYQNDTFLAALLFFLLVFFLEIDNQRQLEKLKKYYIFSALVLAIGIIIMRYTPYAGMSRMTILSYTGEYYDVNFISAYISVPVILLLYDFFEGKRKIIILELAIMCIATLLTGSRTALVIQAIGLVFVLFKQKKVNMRMLFALMALIIIVPAMIQFLPEDIIGHFSSGINVLDDTRRMNDWTAGIELISMKPILGHGLVSSRNLVIENFGVTWVTVHNTYLVFFVNYGLIGGIPAILLMILPLCRLIKYRAPYIYPFAYGMFLVSIGIIEANFSDIMIIPICIFFLMSEYYKNLYHVKANVIKTKKICRNSQVLHGKLTGKF